jgi:hypothetical protein
VETVFTDLLSRLDHGQNIHLESFLGEEINKDVLARVLDTPRSDRMAVFESVAQRLLGISPNPSSRRETLRPDTAFPFSGKSLRTKKAPRERGLSISIRGRAG